MSLISLLGRVTLLIQSQLIHHIDKSATNCIEKVATISRIHL